MALSQIQCLDDNHVNPRTHESKPEFFYCEDQRLALEVLLRDGREAFSKYLQERSLRGFLSDPELDTLAGALEPFDPASEVFPGRAEDDEPPLSLHYWPELSDTSIPQMDLGWPDCDGYRGVTRTTVYTQPPLDGQAHVKEVVRKMIAQAQKVIAVVMDVFTDVDIFRDLLDAGFKRRVSVYILLERKTLPHFMSMCQRANMHAGHHKHLRVRCAEGAEFFTRSCTKVKGNLGHRFMFIDGDKAMSGSYSFSWMSSRLDRNLITVVTGQAVEAFDRLYRFLFMTSTAVDFRQVTMEPEPEPEPIPQAAAPVAPSAAIARKLYNPKYALVAAGNHSPVTSTGHNSPKEPQNHVNSKNQEVLETKKKERRVTRDDIQEAPPLHPGLVNLEKACLISYLPTWPEPDPPSDVIGFINIRDANKPNQVHLQRSEMFETSQAIRFSSPFSKPKETLPEVAQPRQHTAEHEEPTQLQPPQNKTKAGESVVDSVQSAQLSLTNAETGDIKSGEEAPEQKSSASKQNSEPDKDTTKALNTENKLHSNTPTNITQITSQSSTKTSTPNTGKPSHTTQTVTTNSPKPQSPPGSNTKKETSVNTQCAAVHRTHSLQSVPTDSNSNSEQHAQTKAELPQRDSHSRAVHMQPHSSPEMTPNVQMPAVNSHISMSSAMHPQSVSSTSPSEKNHIPIPTVHSGTANNISTSVSPSCASSSLTSTPPIPKPRTVQLVIKDDGTSESQKLPEISVVKRSESLASTGPLVDHNKPHVANVVQTLTEKDQETVPQPENNSGSKRGAEKDSGHTENPVEAPQQQQDVTSQECEKTVGLHDDRSRAEMQSATGTKPQAQSNLLITDAAKADSVNTPEIMPKEVEPKKLMSTDCKITPKTETHCVATVQRDTTAPEGCVLAKVPNDNSDNVTQPKTYHARANEPQKISYCEANPADIDVLETVDSLKASTKTSVSATANSHTAHLAADGKTNVTKHNTHISIASQDSQQAPKARGSSHTPESALLLHLYDTHVPDFRSPTAEREPRQLATLARVPTPDRCLPRTPTPDSRTQTPDPRSRTPDFRTPTPDFSDGYILSRENSTLSTTSEEYYECSDSPFSDPALCNHGTTVDHDIATHSNTPNATTTATCPVSNASNTTEQKTSSGETQSLSGPYTVTTSSVLEKEKMGEKKEATDKKDGSEEDGKETERGGSNDAKRAADHLKQGKELAEVVVKDKEAQASKRKRVLKETAAERPANGGGTPGEPTNKATDAKTLSTSDLKPEKTERQGKEKTVDKAAVRPSSVERRDRPQSTKDTEGQKSGAYSPSRPPRLPRPLSATQPLGSRLWESRQLNQSESKVLHNSFHVSHNTSSPRTPPSRPPPSLAAGVVRSASGRKQVEGFQNHQSLLSQRPAAAQSRVRFGLSQNQHRNPKPEASFLHTPSNLHYQNQAASIREAHRQDGGRAPFTLTFSRLYSLKDLKDKMSKPPAQSRRGSTSSAVQGRKSTS